MKAEPDIAIRFEHISKRFGTLLANNDISLTVRRREIVALLGENGAGKTTLMNILFGHYVADRGTVEVFGRPVTPGSTRAAIAAGVGMVHQHFTLAANLTVLENIETGTESLLRPRLARRRSRQRLHDLSARFGLTVDPDALVGTLTIGERQRVEILKALYREAQVLVLDEPTAVLTPQEASSLFTTLRRMAAEGLAVIFISHKLDEVRANADRILVLRAGAIVAERAPETTTRDELAELMVGRRVTRPRRDTLKPGTSLLEVQGVSLHDGHRLLLDGATFAVREREILGLVGVSGNGQGALADLVTGLAVPTSGRLIILGKSVLRSDPRWLVAAGVARVPDDRHALGVVGDMSVWKNAIIERVGTPRFSRCGIIRRNAAKMYAQELVKRYDIRGAALDRRARLLSGGNLQKLILGRNLAAAPRIIIANQPTRGLDEGAVAQVHTQLLEAKRRGTGILLITEDLDEVIALADRIMAIHRGRLSPAIPTDVADARGLGLMMAGHWDETNHAI
jgi:general nucleoside transport system ATP-binding protein